MVALPPFFFNVEVTDDLHAKKVQFRVCLLAPVVLLQLFQFDLTLLCVFAPTPTGGVAIDVVTDAAFS